MAVISGYSPPMSDPAESPSSRVAPPDAAALIVGPRQAVWLSPDGEIEELAPQAVPARLQQTPPLVCHGRAVARRLGIPRFRAYDLLELFAFVLPARFCLPTPGGLAAALGLPPPVGPEQAALTLLQASEHLLRILAGGLPDQDNAAAIAVAMRQAGWLWGDAVTMALGPPRKNIGPFNGLDVWNRLPTWDESAPPTPPGDATVGENEARARLAELLDEYAEPRPQQSDYAAAAAAAFAPRNVAGAPNMVLAEAGTGVGKTLGYIAPASLWAERNDGTVWISTYTRNLQRQVDQELDRLYPSPTTKTAKTVVRKGRENYLCVLNLEDAVKSGGGRPADTVAAGLMARWTAHTGSGDMTGGDFPSWLIGLLGQNRTLALADHRGECIYSACPHYRKCFIERGIRKARSADIVIANHALVMVQAVLGGEDHHLPLRYIFDEGHHVFDAADSAFGAHLSGSESAEMRRWLLGSEAGRRGSRARGLASRIGDLAAGNEAAETALDEVQRAARALPADGWLKRLAEAAPVGPTETFLDHVRAQVLARSDNPSSRYDLECSTGEPVPGLLDAAATLGEALARLERPMTELMQRLAARLDEEADELDTPTRVRIEAGVRGLKRRAEMVVGAWRQMLRQLGGDTPAAFVDWFGVSRSDGREADIGMYRRWVDPTIPFAGELLSRAHGVLVTSATLRDNPPDAPDDWTSAEVRTGALHLPQPAQRASLASPFDYAGRTRVFIVTDVQRNDADQVAAAYRELFKAAGGGAIGLFTAIQRLRAVHDRIAEPLDAAGIPLLAQHVDAMDTGTLVDIFRAEMDSCLLGTDAVRDGVDVPGRSLRLIVFDRVPWPRPDLLHRARKTAFGGGAYDDMITRLRLKQAYGRLLRRADDAGVFVMLDARTPTRLTTAFPDGVEVNRVGLADAIAETAAFLGGDAA